MAKEGMGWCPHCYTTLSDWQESSGVCPYCGDNLFPNQTITLVPCLNPNCNEHVQFGDSECEQCDIQFTEEDWDFFLATADENMVQLILTQESADDPMMICCSEKFMDCICDKPIMWEDTSRVPVQLWDEIYEYNEPPSSCSSCLHYYTEKCPSLRYFLKEFFQNGIIIEQLNRCSYYEEEPKLYDNAIFINHGEF